MVQTNTYQLLQIIGLSLPFLALYLTVLVEIHKLPRPISVSSGSQQFQPTKEYALTRLEDKEWAGTVTLSYAHQNWDFVFALISIALILLSAITMIASLNSSQTYISNAAFYLLILSYTSAALSVLFTLWFCYKNFSPPDD